MWPFFDKEKTEQELKEIEDKLEKWREMFKLCEIKTRQLRALITDGARKQNKLKARLRG